MGPFENLAHALGEAPELCTLLGMPANVIAALPQLGAIVDAVVIKREGADRRDFRRALVLHLLQAREGEFELDPAAAVKLVEDARRIERVLDAVEAEERAKRASRELRVAQAEQREADAASRIAADLIAEASKEPPLFHDCTFEGCTAVALDGELYCADHLAP